MSLVAVEHILVVPTVEFHRLGYFQGFSAEIPRYLPQLLEPANVSYRPRPEMEKDPSFKQLIPYVIFRHQRPDGTITLFCYTRGKGQGESRLHAKRSIGIGGHISADDASCQNPYEEGMRRELLEEVHIDTQYDGRLVGLINDDLTEVGKVHLGLVHIFDVAEPNVQPKEADICDTGFVPVAELLADTSRFESWSQICLQALFA